VLSAYLNYLGAVAEIMTGYNEHDGGESLSSDICPDGQEIHAFYGNRRYITMFTRVHTWTMSQMDHWKKKVLNSKVCQSFYGFQF
jgi:hypothetical protein